MEVWHRFYTGYNSWSQKRKIIFMFFW